MSGALPEVTLRLLVESDAAFIVELLTDPDFVRFIGDRGVKNVDDARGYVGRIRDSYTKHGFGLWVLEHGGEVLGLCGLVKREGLPHVDVGYALLPRGRGRGLVRAGVVQTLERADAMGLDPLLAIVTQDNGPSRRVLETTGFTYLRLITLPGDPTELCLYERRRG